MNTELMTTEQKLQYEAEQERQQQHEKQMQLMFLQESRRNALHHASLELSRTGGDLLTEAEKIYQWLIKTEA